MLTTRCPDCRTTFRITSALLHQASGQVRCGRCDAVFDAFESLTDSRPQAKLEPDPRPADGPRERPAEPEKSLPVPEEAAAEPDEATAEPPTEVAEPESAADDFVAAPEKPQSLPAQTWHPVERVATESSGWRLAAALACGVLALQVVHHFRVALSETSHVGAWLERAYSMVGMPIPENTDPADFAIVDWVAAAQESENAQPDRLAISTSVRNDGHQPLAYPLLSLRLTDRWEKVIGARVFTPEEYLEGQPSRDAKIAPGATLNAQLELVDPGPDAYGFEVDVCVPIDSQSMRCKSDAVFE